MLSQIAMTVKGLVLLTAAIYGFAALLGKEDAKWLKGAPLKIFIGFFLIGMWGHSVWLLYLAILLAMPVLARDRADAAALYVVSLLAVPVLYYKVSAGSHYLFPVSKYMFCSLGLTIAFLIKKPSQGRRWSHFDIPFLIVMVLEFAQARDPSISETARLFLPMVVTMMLPYFLVTRALATPEDVRRFVLALALGGFVMAIVATAEAHTHWLVYKQIESNLGVSSQVNSFQQVRGGMLRAPGSFAESTSLGTFLALATLAIVALRTSFATRRKWFIAVAILLVGLLAPNSRGALIGMALGLLLFDFYRKQWGPLFVKLGAAVMVYVLLLGAAQFSPYVANLVGKGSDTQSSNDYRLQLFRRGMEEIHKHPILGTNLKNALNNLQDIQQGQHIVDLVNGYISYGLTLGYPGIAGLLMVFASLCAAMLMARRKLSANPMLSDLAAFAFSVSGFMIVVSFFTSFGGEGSTTFYMVAALGSVLWALRGAAMSPSHAVATGQVVSTRSSLQQQIFDDREAARLRRPRLSVELP